MWFIKIIDQLLFKYFKKMYSFTLFVIFVMFNVNIHAHSLPKSHQITIQNTDKMKPVASLMVKRETLQEMVQKFKNKKEPLLGMLKKDDFKNTLQKKPATVKPLFKTLRSSNGPSQAFQDIQSRFKDMVAKARLSAPQLKLRSDLNKDEKTNLAARYKKLHGEIKQRVASANTNVPKSTKSTIRMRNRIDADDGKVGRISLPRKLISKSETKTQVESSSKPKETVSATLSSTTELAKEIATVSSTTVTPAEHIVENSNKETKNHDTSEKVSTAIEKIKTMQKDSVSHMKSRLAEIMSKNQ